MAAAAAPENRHYYSFHLFASMYVADVAALSRFEADDREKRSACICVCVCMYVEASSSVERLELHLWPLGWLRLLRLIKL